MTEQRRRDSAASREALLDAAVELFAERGYDRTTVRDIAGRAGVNQALLFRYFGSKEAMFAAVIARSSRDHLAAAPQEAVFARVLRATVTKQPGVEPAVQIMLRAASEDVAAKQIRHELGEDYVRALSALTDSPDAALRAQLALAWLLGIDLVRSVTGMDPLASASSDEIVGCVLPAVRTLLERATDVPDEDPEEDPDVTV